jgi:hypothetical protein
MASTAAAAAAAAAAAMTVPASGLDVLPEENASYGTLEYWEERYER